ncbi:hypothetical protein OBBRIDRAFT_806536 [Obba rivulosa]|uniref:Protein kinase domain-containing protein n=1 Tax=Obba rivulosa TaxID=1052685 RepID=A0A8E2AU83_9APHY|nr:hypothetical protein OBBRIDRAFT_806536 [Obba rivulosa]
MTSVVLPVVNRDESQQLPISLLAWRRLHPLLNEDWFWPWESLREFFGNSGYALYYGRNQGLFCDPPDSSPPSVDSFGLFGDRVDFPKHQLKMEPYPLAMAAWDSANRDVVIKVVSKGDEGAKELEILQYLNSEPLRSYAGNTTVPILDFLHFDDWRFAVMPRCDPSDSLPFRDAGECLEFSDQILSALAFLHNHRIAHLDISNENILLNHRGQIPDTTDFCPESPYGFVAIWPPHPWRSTFPVQYLLIDFGYSVRFPPDAPLSACTAVPNSGGREHRPAEALESNPCNPFAVDVYQTARLFYGWFADVVHSTPGFLELLQDMSSFNPARRPSAAESLARFRAFRHLFPKDQLHEVHEYALFSFPLVPRPHWVMVRDLLECRRWYFTFDYITHALKDWVLHVLGRKPKNGP